MVELLLLALLLFLPGFALTKVVFPARGSLSGRHEALYLALLAVVLSASLAVLYTFALVALGAALPAGVPGYFTAPNVWGGLAALTTALLFAAWWRGAFPRLARLHPLLARPPAAGPAVEGVPPAFARLKALARERDRLRQSPNNPDWARLAEIEAEMRRLEAELLDEAEP